jgi:hypothetical protein
MPSRPRIADELAAALTWPVSPWQQGGIGAPFPTGIMRGWDRKRA